MKKQLDFIKALFNDFEEDCSLHIKTEYNIWEVK